MRKILASLLLISLLILSGCSSHTITDKPENYLYKPNDVIHIYDNSDTRDLLGILKITSVNILSEKPFVHKEENGYDANSKPVYKDVTYNQIIQVNYTYTVKNGGNPISADNFYVTDSRSTLGLKNPDTEYHTMDVKNTKHFVAAMQTKSDVINICFNYSIFQLTPTAKIQAEISSQSSHAEEPTSTSHAKESSQASGQKSSRSTGFPSSGGTSSSYGQVDGRIMLLTAIILFMSVVIIVLIVMLAVSKKKNE